MKKLTIIWLKSLGLTSIAFMFLLASIITDAKIIFIFCILLFIYAVILSIIMVFRSDVGRRKKIICCLFLPSTIYLISVFIFFYALFYTFSQGDIFSNWPY